MENVEGYCVRCRAKRIMRNAKDYVKKNKYGNKVYITKGICPVCKARMTLLSSKK